MNYATEERASRAEDFALLMQKLHRVHASGRTRDRRWRDGQLEGLERLLGECEAEIIEALKSDLGRHPAEALLGDIASTRGELSYARRHLRKWMRKQHFALPLKQLPGRAWVQYEPLGTVLIIGPWNYPVYLSLSPLVAAVAAGNCVVLKPSEWAPASSALLARLVPQYLDSEAVVVVEGDGAITQDLLSQGFDHALFTGGTEIGRKIMAGAASNLTPVTLELGGKSPVIVAADADLDVAARRIVWSKMLNSGQTCIAPDYVLVDESVKAEFVDRICRTISEFCADRPGADLRVVNDRQFDRLSSYVSETKGRVVFGGSCDKKNLTIEVTVIVDPERDEPAMVSEIFGPVLPIVGVRSVGDAINYVNSGTKPLASYIFSRSRKTQNTLIASISAGGSVINHVAMHSLIPQLPFGGVGASGMGAYHGRWGFETFSHRRAVLRKTFKPDVQLIYPPYTPKSIALLRRLF